MSILQTLRNISLLGLLLCALGDDAQAQWSGRSAPSYSNARYGAPAYRGLPSHGYGIGGARSGSVVSVGLGGALPQGAGIRVQRTRVRDSHQGVWAPTRAVWVRVNGTLQRRVVGGYYAQQGARVRVNQGAVQYRGRSSSQIRIRL